MRDWIMFYIGCFTMMFSMALNAGFWISVVIGLAGGLTVILLQEYFDAKSS